MSKKKAFSYFSIVIFILVAFFSLKILRSAEKILEYSRYYSGEISLVPEPVPPQGSAGTENSMVLLSKPKNFSAARFSSFARNGGNNDTIYVPAGGEEITLADIKGPGAITHIWTTYQGGGRELIIRIYWEGNLNPSVEAPLGDFFGVAMGLDAEMNSFPIQVSSNGRARNCWWYMPFNKSAKITVSNVRSEENFKDKDAGIRLYYYIDYQIYNKPIKDIMYFHCQFRETDPTERGKLVKLCEIEGDGHFVGIVMGHRARTPGWFGEGDDIITVDGQVSFVGTGTEDYFCDAWGFRVFSDLYHGVPVYEGREIGHRLSAYRFHIIDPIPFRKSFKFEIEHWPWFTSLPNTGREYYSSTAFWYQKSLHKPWPRLEKIISNEPWDPIKGRWHFPGAIEAEELGILEYESKATDLIPLNLQPIKPSYSASAEQLRAALQFPGKPFAHFLMPNLSGDYMLVFDSGGEGNFSLAVPAKEDGIYNVKIYFIRGENFGAVQVSINGKAACEPIDLYLRTLNGLSRPIWPPKEYLFPAVSLKEGLNIFNFAVNSKNSESAGYKMGIDCIVLEKVN